MSRPSQRSSRGAIELIEEAVALLRSAPLATLIDYYVGALPFMLGLLYFWADMSRGAYSWQHCPEAALGLAILYVWMKCWHAVFAVRLHGQLTGHTDHRWPLDRVIRMIATQAWVQSTSLFLLPAAAVLTVPYGWVYAFYNNVTLFGDGSEADIRSVVRRSWRQAAHLPAQNHAAMAVLWSFALIVFLNVAIGLAAVPVLMKMLLGIETAFTMSLSTLLNSTFLAVAGGITYLCVNPLVKALYILRCFYGESRQTGADLKARLRALVPAAALLVLVMLTAFPTRAAADEPPPDNPALATQLDQSIDQVITQPEFSWRLPREKEPNDNEKGFLERWLDKLQAMAHWTMELVGRIMEKIIKWLSPLFPSRTPKPSISMDWGSALYALFILVIALTVGLLVVLAVRVWQERRQRPTSMVAEPESPNVDVTDENIIADQLPPEGWLKTARELMAAGELRLALRALYLATLSDLGRQALIRITKFKSNRDYESELRRHAREQPPLLAAFSANMLTFENVWYGMHEVTPETVERFLANVNLIRGPRAR